MPKFNKHYEEYSFVIITVIHNANKFNKMETKI